ncbi:MAG: glycosyltransferase family 4 protein [Pirellulales bacterium]
MRIVLIAEVYLPKVDGVVVRTMNLIRQLVAVGDEVTVICPDAGDEGTSQVPVVRLPSFECVSYPEYRIGRPDARLLSTIEEIAPDVIHFVNPFAFGFQCFDVLARAGVRVPCLFSFHTLYGEFAKRYRLTKPVASVLWWLSRKYHNYADLNLTVSSTTQHDLQRRGFERVDLWPPAVDAELFHPRRACAEMRSRLSGGQPHSPLLITVSRLAPEKNVKLLADVLERLPGVRLAIVGDGPQRAELERFFPSDKTTFVGYLAGEDLAAAYASSDAFVFASETETMGNVVLEAMASGLCVVAPRAGGIRSLVAERETGLLFSAGAASEAAAHVRHLLSEPRQRHAISAAARRSAESCSWANAAAEVRGSYRKAAANHRSNGHARSQSRAASRVLGGLVTTYRVAAVVNGYAKTFGGILNPPQPYANGSPGRRLLHDAHEMCGS